MLQHNKMKQTMSFSTTLVIGNGFLGEHIVNNLKTEQVFAVKLTDFLCGQYDSHLTTNTTIILTSAVVRHSLNDGDYALMKYINVDCAVDVAKKAVKHKCKAFFFISTTGAVDENQPCDGPPMNSTSRNSRNSWPYYHLKARCERQIAQYYDDLKETQTRFVFFRLPMLIGPPHSRNGLLGAQRSNRILINLINGKLFLDLGGIITICDVRDAAQQIAKAVDENVSSGCVEYIGIIGHNITITDLAHAMNCKEPYFSVLPSIGNFVGLCLSSLNVKLFGFDGLTFQMGSHNWGAYTKSKHMETMPLIKTVNDVRSFYKRSNGFLCIPPQKEEHEIQPKKKDPVRVYDGFNFKSLSQSCLEGQNYFVTGGTGFLGKMIIARLCLLTKPKSIYILVRGKSSRSADKRFRAILESPPLQKALEINKNVELKMVEGDCTQHLLGIDYPTLATLKSSIDVVIHSAASVSFTDSLKTCISNNVKSVSRLADLVNVFDSCPRMVYVSTAYVNRRSTTKLHAANTRAFSGLSSEMELDKVIQSACVSGFRRDNAYGFTNAYTFSKALAEEKLRYRLNQRTQLCIVRPSVIIESCSWPFPGYHFRMGGSIGVIYAILNKMVTRRYIAEDNDVYLNEVPVDMCADKIVEVASAQMENNSNKIQQFTYANSTSPKGTAPSKFRLCKFASIYGGIYNLPYQHQILMFMRWIYARLFHGSIHSNKIKNLAMILAENRTFVKKDFCFASDIKCMPPLSKDCTVLFLRDQIQNRIHGEKKEDKGIVSNDFVDIAGQRSDEKSTIQRMEEVLPFQWLLLSSFVLLWVILNMPFAVILMCTWAFVSCTCIEFKHDISPVYTILSYPIARILDTFYSHVWIHKHSMYKIDCTSKDVVVFCSSHSSYMDFILIPFIAYIFPLEFQIQRPNIVACESFAKIPVLGRLLKWCGAIFVSREKGTRGRSQTSSGLNMSDVFLSKILKQKGKGKPISFLVFPWGTRSRNDMAMDGKSGALIALDKAINSVGATVKYVSVGITYDRRLDETLLFEEKRRSINGHTSGCIKTFGLWIANAFKTRMLSNTNHVYGNIYVKFKSVCRKEDESVPMLTNRICNTINSLRYVSLYDIQCICKHTEFSKEEVVSKLQCKFNIAPLPLCDQWKYMLANDKYTLLRYAKYKPFL